MTRSIRLLFMVFLILLFGLSASFSFAAPTPAKKTVLAELFTANW